MKKAEKTMHRAVHQVEKRVEHAAKEVKKDVVHISREAREAFHHAEKKAEQVVKHATHHVKKAEKAVHRAVHQVEKRVERAAKEVAKDAGHIGHKAKEVFQHVEKKAEQAVQHVVHDVKKAEKAIHRTAHHIEHKLGHEIKALEKTADRGIHKIEQKAEHIAKQTVHDIIHAGHKVEQTARQVAKNAEKSWHGLTKHPIESTVEFVRGAGDAALQDVTYNLAHRPYHSSHPVAYEWGQMTGHAVSTVTGVVETAGSIPLAAAGIALSGTGVGAAIGAPATAIAVAGATHGATLATTGSSHFVQHANELYQRMSRGEGVSGKAVKGTGNSQVKQNKAKGDAFEQEVINKISSEPANTNVRQQITVKTKSGVKTRIDIISTNSQTGQIRCIECKASSTAPLTKNQKKAFPEIEQSGAIVVGKGKAPYTGGTKIPPTKIEIIRKK
ncbi:hypothetical protein ACPVTF_08095 [Geobacillus icigianus]|nr:hypothetical protein [Geobacillus subterraneus]